MTPEEIRMLERHYREMRRPMISPEVDECRRCRDPITWGELCETCFAELSQGEST